MKAEYPDHLDYWGLVHAFDRGRTGDLRIMRPTRCQLRHESCLHHISTHNNFILLKFYLFAIIKDSTPAGFEPARAKPNRFLIYRLNHSATVSKLLNNMVMLHSKSKSVGAWGGSNPRPLAPEARIIPLDHKPTLHMKCETDFFLLSIPCIIIYL